MSRRVAYISATRAGARLAYLDVFRRQICAWLLRWGGGLGESSDPCAGYPFAARFTRTFLEGACFLRPPFALSVQSCIGIPKRS